MKFNQKLFDLLKPSHHYCFSLDNIIFHIILLHPTALNWQLVHLRPQRGAANRRKTPTVSSLFTILFNSSSTKCLL